MMTQMSFALRPATPADPADALLYTSAKPYYDAYAGSEARARALLAAVYGRTGHAASFEVCSVVELEGDLAGVIAWFPVDEGDARARRFVALTAPRVPPWHWPRLLRHLRAAGHGLPQPAAEHALRRRAGRRARLPPPRRGDRAAGRRRARPRRAAGLQGVALDTGLHNEPARALYERTGFRQREIRRAPNPTVAAAIGGPGFVGYFKPL